MYAVLQYSTVQYSTVQHGTVQYSTVRVLTGMRSKEILVLILPSACPHAYQRLLL